MKAYSLGQLGLFDTPADRWQIRLAILICCVQLAALLPAATFRDVRLPEFDAFVPAIDSIMFVSDLIVASLLYAQASVFRSRALTILASGYVFSALMLIPHALTFPGAFAPHGLLGAGTNTTSWTYMFRRAGPLIAITLYALLKRADLAANSAIERAPPRIAWSLFAAIALAWVVTLLTTRGHHLLPSLYLNRYDANAGNMIKYNVGYIVMSLVAMGLLLRQRKSLLDVWLLVALSGWLVQSFLILVVAGRFTVGFYYQFFLVLVSSLVVMLALIAESNRLYARLALAAGARAREREARLTSIDAVAATICHEVGQPLSAVVSSATAGLYLLDRTPPDVERAMASFRTTVDAGNRGFDVIRSIRAMFSKGQARATQVNLNDLVRDTAALLDRELAGGKVSLELALDEALPPVLVDRVQMQQVLINLLTNAIEAMIATRGRPRRISVRSAALKDRDVLIEVSDTGDGIAPDVMPQIFEVFYTTKPTGTGLGLALCRNIVEEHGGRLWASPGEKQGAIFHLQLPRAA